MLARDKSNPCSFHHHRVRVRRTSTMYPLYYVLTNLHNAADTSVRTFTA